MVQGHDQAVGSCGWCRGTGMRERLVPREPGSADKFYRLMPCRKCAKEVAEWTALNAAGT